MKYWSLLIIFSLTSLVIHAQDQVPTEKKQGWTTKLDVGLDLVSNLLINPSVGGGESRLGAGASLGLNTIYNDGNFSWTNALNMQFGVQKIGTGYLEDFPDKKVPFQKNIDNIWYNSKIAQRTSYFSKFYYTTDLFFSSQLTKTYEDNFLSDVTGRGHPISQFLSPGIFQASLGMDYRPNDYWSIFLSPASYKVTIVLDDQIADDFATDESGEFLGSIHGNPYEELDNGDIRFENYDNQFGGSLRVSYQNQFSNRLSISSNLLLFSNYNRDPDHIDVNWRNMIDVTIFKGLKLSLLSLVNYDHDIFVEITDYDEIDGVKGFGRRVSYTQQVLLKYSFEFDQNNKDF